MDVHFANCAGLDVHKQTIVACRIARQVHGKRVMETRTFGTMTADILLLGEWLGLANVTHVAMESTGFTGSRSGICWREASHCGW